MPIVSSLIVSISCRRAQSKQNACLHSQGSNTAFVTAISLLQLQQFRGTASCAGVIVGGVTRALWLLDDEDDDCVIDVVARDG